jgi:heptosyltransferase-2
MIPPDTTEVSRLVVRPPNWLGDAVLALPALAAVRRHFASAALTIAAPPAVAALFGEETGARPDAILELPDRSRAEIAALAGLRAELGILFPNSFRSAWDMRRAGIPMRWGYARSWRGALLTKRAIRPRLHGVQHQADYYRALVRGLGIPCDDAAPELRATAGSRGRAAALLAEQGVDPAARLIAFAPGAAYGHAKQWAPDRVAALAARLVAERGATCVILGAAHDQPAARAIESWLSAHARDAAPRVIDLVGRTNINALAGVLAACDLLVSNDSGAMHLAAALGRPIVAVFGPTDERATRPLGTHALVTAPVFCRPCMLRDCPIDHRCMTRITVEMVFAAVSRQLAFAKATF